MVRIANRLQQRGCVVKLCCGIATGACVALLDPKIEVIDLRKYRVVRALLPLCAVIRRTQPDAVYSTMQHANIIAALACRLSGINTKLVLREAVSVHQISEYSSVMQIVLKRLTKFSYRYADHIISVSEGVQRDLLIFLGYTRLEPAQLQRFQVIYNPIDPELKIRALEPMRPSPDLAIKDLPFVIGIGRLSKHKDFKTLIKAVSIVQRTHTIGVVILGEGEERNALEVLAAKLGVNTIFMPGFVDNIYPFLRHASVFVLSSRNEGLPNVLIEAQAMGLPLVATRCPSGPEEILDHGQLGELVPVGDATAMAAAIELQLTKNPPENYDEHVRTIQTRYELDSIVDRYLHAGGLQY